MFQTEDEENSKTKEISQQISGCHNDSPDVESCTSDNFDNGTSEIAENNELELFKQTQFIEKLQRLSQLKRKSEEFLQKTYYSDILNAEKRPRINDKLAYSKINNHLLQNNNYDTLKNFYNESPVNITPSLNMTNHKASIDKEINDNCNDKPMTTNPLELKTECEDVDIVVTDPAVCTTPKSFEASRDGKNNSSVATEYQSPQDSEYFQVINYSFTYLICVLLVIFCSVKICHFHIYLDFT